MSGLDWALAADFSSVTVTFPTNPPVALQIDLAGVEDILRNLGEFRAAMSPEVTRQAPVTGKVAAIPNPAWYTQPEAMQGDGLFHISDPRYGWLHYLIPRIEAAKLSALLKTQAELPGQAAGPRN
jgi:hypothetical protein